MTVNQAYEASLAFLMEKPHEDLAFFENVMELVNACLYELTPAENSIRRQAGEEQVSFLYVTSFNEEIPIDKSLEGAIPLYLASHFFRDDLNDGAAEDFYARFRELVSQRTQATFTGIEDLYGAGDE